MNNGRRHSLKIKERARFLRRNGLTHREIAQTLKSSCGSVWLWTRGINLTLEQKKDIQERRYKLTFTKQRRRNLSRSARINLASFWKKPYTKKYLLDKIRRFYFDYDRIPLKGEFNMYREYQQRFGSWNKAIRLAGFKPNQVIFSNKFIAKDGHKCDSYAEKIIDDWLNKNNINHTKNFSYPNEKMTADFAVKNIMIEYFGLKGLNKIYDQTIERKRQLSQEQGLKLIEIYPVDLFSKNSKIRLRKILKKITS